MVVLLVVGLMNLVWMVLLSLVFVVEKHWRAPAISRVVGVALLIVGLAVVVRPSLMHTVSGVGDKPPPMTMPM